jgi:hypothetical protein
MLSSGTLVARRAKSPIVPFREQCAKIGDARWEARQIMAVS